VTDGDGLIAQGRRPWPFDRRRLLVLDGTANAEILGQFVPSLGTVPEIRVQRNAHVIQVSNMTFYRGSLIKRTSRADGKPKLEPTARLLEVGEFIARTALTGKTLAVTNKPVRCALTGEDEHSPLAISAQYRGVDVAHFGNIRGSNEFEGHEIVVILGRDEPSVEGAERRAMTIWYDTTEPIRRITPDLKGRINYPSRTRRYLMRDGTTRPVNVARRWLSRAARLRWSRPLTGCGSFTTRSARRSTSFATSPWTSRSTSWSPGNSSLGTGG
jgi:hypothetical protein